MSHRQPEPTAESGFLLSALTRDNRFQPTAEVRSWLRERQRDAAYSVRCIPLERLADWRFEEGSGDLVHKSGKFFRVEGLRVRTNFPWSRSEWDQPILNQPEIGILGIVTRVVEGVRYFLLQAKMEPGNVNLVQLSPTLQATRSNFRRVHEGRTPRYLEYFLDENARILVDQLQSEHGTRFLRKRNRNMIVEVAGEVPPHEDFRWLTLREIKALLREDDLVNMDTRTVISCLPWIAEIRDGGTGADPATLRGFGRELWTSLTVRRRLHSTEQIISWFTRLKTRYSLEVSYLPLAEVRDWGRAGGAIRHRDGRYFSVIGVEVEAGEREVPAWNQPILAHDGLALAGFLAQKIDGVLHFLVQAKSEPGIFDVVEMAPTISVFDVDRRARDGDPTPFFRYFMEASEEKVRFSAILSEEGGRLYHLRCRYMIVEAGEEERLEVPENFIWMTLGQILSFVRYNNYFNIEARGLLSCIDFSDGADGDA